jgi:hypothetical protein
MTASFLELIDLASARLGAAVVAANDEFFAPKENLIKASAPVWREGEYTDWGKWMDGWETRRRRDLGPNAHDWCIVRLGARGIVHGIDVNTAFFTGNYPESCAVDGSDVPGMPTPEQLMRTAWRELLPRTPLKGDTHNVIPVVNAFPATHLRFRIYPDGGVARLRVHGEVIGDWDRLRRQGDVDLAAAEHGGTVVACSDMFYGSRHNLIMPGEATPRARPRLDDRPAWRAGDHPARRGRHTALQGERARGMQPGCRAPGGGPVARTGTVARIAAANAAAAAYPSCVRGSARGSWDRHTRAAQHLSRWRHRPASALGASTMTSPLDGPDVQAPAAGGAG